MRKSLALAATFALFATTQVFAIAGLGAHYVYNMGATLKGGTENVASIGGQDVKLTREKASDLQGLGFKFWFDLLPIIDIEGTLNIAATRYSAYLQIDGVAEKTYLEYAPEAPFSMVFDKASPVYGVVSGDFSITYPFDIIPMILKSYLGAGVSYMAGIPLVDKKFAENVLKTPGLLDDPANVDEKAVTKAFSDALTKSDYTTGIGGHIILGLRIKPPVIPLAVYANTKRYFGGNLHDKFSQGFVFELGGGFAL